MSKRIADFALSLTWASIPQEVRKQAKLAFLDVLGATLAGHKTRVGKMVSDFAAEHWSGKEASIILSSRRASPVGAALANGSLANALDIDDGYRAVKGHPGAVVFPATLAAAEYTGADGEDFLTALIVGYEVAIRSGLAWHATYREYHGSGAWGAVGATAAAGKLLGLDHGQLVHALGIAEYHAPIAPIMRCVEHPTMVKDGIGWGAMTGVSAALLARGGFTGAPSLFDAQNGLDLVSDLGSNFRIQGLYFKEHACCRWAQPPIEAISTLQTQHRIQSEEICKIRVRTFEAALRLGTAPPHTTEEAQYNLSWPLAAALVDGWSGPEQVSERRLDDESIRALAAKVEGYHSPEIEQFFPADALCEVEIEMRDGAVYSSGLVGAKGDATRPLSASDLQRKFRLLASQVLQREEVSKIEDLIEELEKAGKLDTLLRIIRVPL